MSRPFAPALVTATLKRLGQASQPPRVAVLGIGNELRRDDGAGIVVARALRSLVSANSRLLVIDAGPVPENFTGQLRRFEPSLVLIVDAAQLGELAGAVRCVSWQRSSGFSASTHSLPLHVLAGYLTAELGCEVLLLGIQPADIATGARLSAIVERSVEHLVIALANLLHDTYAQGWAKRTGTGSFLSTSEVPPQRENYPSQHRRE
jgi:hydrogenase 3 maturation protease